MRARLPRSLRALHRAGHEEGVVVDLGCGTGILSRIVAEAGYDVLGLDQSAQMLKIARRNAPQARFKRASFVDAQLPDCVAVAAVGEVLGYAFDARAGRTALRSLFERVQVALRPRGVFDLAGLGAVLWGAREQGSSRGPTGPSIRRRAKTAQRAPWIVTSVFFRRQGRLYRRGEELHVLNLHDRASFWTTSPRPASEPVGFGITATSGFRRASMASSQPTGADVTGPVLYPFVRELADSERFRAFLEELPDTRARVSEPALPLLLATIYEELARPIVVLAPEDADARDAAEAAGWFLGDERVALLPSRGVSRGSGLGRRHT